MAQDANRRGAVNVGDDERSQTKSKTIDYSRLLIYTKYYKILPSIKYISIFG